jgi:cysteinyl-tRNA synthetase
MLLSTHYRRPIEFNDEVLTAARKGLSVFHRLIERVDRVKPAPAPAPAPTTQAAHGEKEPDMDRMAAGLFESEHAHFARAILNFKMKFLEMMDDDFNTAGAIAVLHEMAGQINSFIQQTDLEAKKHPDTIAAAAAAVQSLKNLGGILGLFRQPIQRPSQKDAGLTDQLMKLLIQLRQDARASKNFALGDAIRKGLTDIGITLEDRPDGTEWRKE